LTLLQPHAPLVRQAVPSALPEQSPQTACPVSAHAAEVSPGWQVPPEAAEQQPPLHTSVELQAVPQTLVVELQALPVGQSPAALQPQTPETHWSPAEAFVQSMQAPPAGPQAVLLIVTHWPVESQQNPAPQFPPEVPPTTHWDVQALFWHVGVLPLQVVQISPLPPHALLLAPAVQVLFSQQPPLHSWVGPQAFVHLRVLMSQALPVGQSLGPLHPQTLFTQADPSAFPTQLTQFPGVPQLVEVLAQPPSRETIWSGGVASDRRSDAASAPPSGTGASVPVSSSTLPSLMTV
jgi:hypothetical protein